MIGGELEKHNLKWMVNVKNKKGNWNGIAATFNRKDARKIASLLRKS